jgi:hypothetical protein
MICSKRKLSPLDDETSLSKRVQKTPQTANGDTAPKYHTPPLPSLGSLADELLLNIFGRVPGTYLERRKTYYNLALTSKHLNGSATACLYSEFQAMEEGSRKKFLRTRFEPCSESLGSANLLDISTSRKYKYV